MMPAVRAVPAVPAARARQETETLVGLVERYSPTFHEAPAVDWLVERMRGLGFEARKDAAGNAVGGIGKGPVELLLVGHIDTVPGELLVTLRDGVLRGRGTVDAKGPLAAFVSASARLAGSERVRITVVGAVGEEAHSPGARHLIGKHRPAVILIGEPSGTSGVTIGYRGTLNFEFTSAGEEHHTAVPRENPLERSVNLWNAVVAWCDERAGPTDFGSPVPTLQRLETERDGVRFKVSGRINVRTPVGFDPQAFRTAVAAARDRIHPALALHWLDHEPAVLTDKRNHLIAAFLRSLRANGEKPRFVKKLGTSDMNVLHPHYPGVPIVAYGPGDSRLDHTPHEAVPIAEYGKAVDVLEGVLKAF